MENIWLAITEYGFSASMGDLSKSSSASNICKYDLFSAVIAAFWGRIVTPNFLSMRVQYFAILVANLPLKKGINLSIT